MRFSISGCRRIKLTPNGFKVFFRVSSISISSAVLDIEPAAITPKPPAFEIAETKFLSDNQVIAPPIIGYFVSRNWLPFLKRFKRILLFINHQVYMQCEELAKLSSFFLIL